MASDGVPAYHPNRIGPGYVGYLAAAGVLALLASVSVVIRLIHRRRAGDLWWDDWTIVAALIFGLGIFVCNVLLALPSFGGAGYPVDTYPIEQLRVWAKIALALDILYIPSVSLSRASLLLFYWRIFAVKGSVLIAARVIFFILAGSSVGSIICLIFSYNPVQAQWILTIPYTTINAKAFYVSSGVIKAVIDIALIGLAIGQVVTLQLSKKHKLLLSALFLFTLFNTAATTARITFLAISDLGNPTQVFETGGIWLNIEMYTAIINACLPGMYSFFRTLCSRSSRKESRPPRTEVPRTLITIGSSPPRFKHRGDDMEHGYEAICEPVSDAETHSMAPLAPVRVDVEFHVQSQRRHSVDLPIGAGLHNAHPTGPPTGGEISTKYSATG